MNLFEQVLKEAENIPPVPGPAARAYEEKQADLAGFVNRQMESLAAIRSLTGHNPASLLQDNNRNHARFMAAVFKLNRSELLVRTIPWVYRTSRGRGFSLDFFPAILEVWCDAVAALLEPAHAEPILAVYRWMRARHSEMARLAEAAPASIQPPPGPLDGIRPLFLSHLLAGQSAQAARLAEQSVTCAEDLKAFYLPMLQSCMIEIGIRWERGEISVAQEHLATAIAGRIMSMFYGSYVVRQPDKGRAVVTAAPNEFHELGARMVADFLEMDGWEVHYLGANTPAADLIELLASSPWHFLAVSVAMPFNLDHARELISDLKAHRGTREIPVMLGGRVIAEMPGLAAETGADGWAPDAAAAVRLADRWYHGQGRA
jgi:methanogenic corrinoid protein MtbC1